MISFAFATPNFTWGGAEIHILWLAAGVTRARCAGVAVSGYGGVDPLMAAELVKHCPLVGDTHKSPRPFAPGLACDGFPDFPAAVRHACRDADVLLTWGSLQVARFTQGLGIPVVVISHCSVPHGSVCDGATHLVGVSEVALEPFRGVRGAERLVLHHGDMRRGLALHRRHVRADDEHDAVEHLLATGQQMAQHWTAGDLVQGLGQRGLHAGAESGGEDHGGSLHRLAFLVCRCCGHRAYAVSKPVAILLLQFAFRSATT